MRADIYGAEYEIQGGGGFPFYTNQRLHNMDVPCAVCLVEGRNTLMIPAMMTCPVSWRREYHGYLMTARYNHPRRNYVCMDQHPDVILGGAADINGALFYNIESRCGSLHCPNYVDGRELTCVVCTK